MKKVIVSSLLFLFLGFVLGYYFKGREIPDKKGTIVINEENISFSNSHVLLEEDIKRVIDLFEKLHVNRDAEKIMKMFSPPRTEQEAKDYEHIMFLDLPFTYPRLFTAAEFNYRVDSYKIIKINITKDKATAEIEEMIKEYNNETTERSAPKNRFMIIEFYKLGNNILIERYYKKGDVAEKYGFGAN